MNASAECYPLATVAQILKVTRPLILRLVRQGDLPALRTPQGLKVEPGALAQWVDVQSALAAREAAGLANP